MRRFKIPLLVVAFSLLMAGMAAALDLPQITTWLSGGVAPVQIPGLMVGMTGGRGDVLLSPLYDVRPLIDPGLPGGPGTLSHPETTLIAIVNTDPTFGVVGRIRFREWKRSSEVLDFDIPLTSNDVWVGQVARLPTGGAFITSPDLYISNIPAGVNDPFIAAPVPVGGFAFNPILINDGDTAPLARTEYGDFEFIGEEIFLSLTASGTVNRVPIPLAAGATRDVGNTLEGVVYIVRSDIAISHEYAMVPIANFAINPNGIWQPPTTPLPTLLSAVQGGPNPANPVNPGAGGFDNLEALMSKSFIDYQYATGLDPKDITQTPTTTSVVVTFPTKFFHYEPHTSPFAATAVYPFLPPFTGLRETLGDDARTPALPSPAVGEIVLCPIWDRNENLLQAPTIPISPAGVAGICQIPYEVNVIGLSTTGTVAFRNNLALTTTSGGATFYSGWGRINLSPLVPTSSGDTRTVPQGKAPTLFNFFNNFFNAYRGLPAIGIVMTEFFNSSVNGYFGNTVPWNYGVDWRTTGSLLP